MIATTMMLHGLGCGSKSTNNAPFAVPLQPNQKRTNIDDSLLKPRPRIAIVALSGPILNDERYNMGLDILSERYDIVYAHNPLSASNAQAPYLSNTDPGRISEFEYVVNNLDVDAIMFARGGYGLLPIANQLPVPKRSIPIIGFSDITALLAAWQLQPVKMVHGTVVIQLPSLHPDDIQLLFDYLDHSIEHSDVLPVHTIHVTPLDVPEQKEPGIYTHIDDDTPLQIFGGNLATLASLCGTPIAPQYANTILFIEDVHEAPYKIDRMMTQLLLGSDIRDVRGILIGDFLHKGSRIDSKEVISTLRNAFDNQLPPIFGYVPSGHADRNVPIPLGESVSLEVHLSTE